MLEATLGACKDVYQAIGIGGRIAEIIASPTVSSGIQLANLEVRRFDELWCTALRSAE